MWWTYTVLLKKITNNESIIIKKVILNTPKNGKILEIGCGTCFHSIFLSYLGYRVTAIDVDYNVLEYAKRNNLYLYGKVNIEYGNMFNLKYSDNSFDTIFHDGVLEHFHDNEILSALREQYRVSSTVVFSVPTNNAKGAPDLYGDERLLTVDQWREIINKTSWKIKDIFWFNFQATLPWKFIFLYHRLSKYQVRYACNIGFVLRK